MQFVLPWKQSIAEYHSGFKDLQIEPPKRCPHCGCGKLHKWGSYERYVIEESDEHRIGVRRIRCVRCRKTYSYLPSFCVSRVCYSVDFVMTFLKVLLLKLRASLGELRRRAYVFLRRFVRSENLWLVFLRAKGFGDFPIDRKERTVRIFTALLNFHEEGNFMPGFFQETGRHFMSAK